MEIHRTKILIILFLLAFLERTVWDLGPNAELITLAMVISAFYFGQKQSLWLTFLILVSSDLILGNTNIFLFTWSGFLIPVFFLKYFKRTSGLKRIYQGTLAGVSANLFFYLWTNLGVWFLDSWNMYSRDLSGLLSCFINGLPFLKMQLTSTLVFIPLGFILFEVKGGEIYDWICCQYRRINFSKLKL